MKPRFFLGSLRHCLLGRHLQIRFRYTPEEPNSHKEAKENKNKEYIRIFVI